jgi:adenylyltransferase/sulfurtransferase
MGEISFYNPQSGACYECGMTRSMWQRLNQRRSCVLAGKILPADAVPTTVILASLTAALQVQEAIAYLHRSAAPNMQRLSPGEMVTISVAPYETFVMSTAVNPACSAHEMRVPDFFLSATPDELTADDVCEAVPESIALSLDFDLVTGLECANCGSEAVAIPLHRLNKGLLKCPSCSGERTVHLSHEIPRRTFLASVSLAELGVPYQSILKVRMKDGFIAVELLQPRSSKVSTIISGVQ